MPGAIKLSRIPYGFFEKEMWGYFSQFGRVEKLKLFRSKKSGNSKGFAFVQFTYESVAKIASETMNNYLMFDKLLKCEYIPESGIQPSMFKNWQRIVIPRLGEERHKKKVNSFKDDAHVAKSRRRLYIKLVKRNKQLQQQGIDYQFKIPPFPDGMQVAVKQDTKVENSDSDGETIEPNDTIASPVSSQPSLYSMLIDSSDDEIELKTPPQSVRRRKPSEDEVPEIDIDELSVKDEPASEDEEAAVKKAADTADFIKFSASKPTSKKRKEQHKISPGDHVPKKKVRNVKRYFTTVQ